MLRREFLGGMGAALLAGVPARMAGERLAEAAKKQLGRDDGV